MLLRIYFVNTNRLRTSTVSAITEPRYGLLQPRGGLLTFSISLATALAGILAAGRDDASHIGLGLLRQDIAGQARSPLDSSSSTT